jgi:hypothetical protein
LLPVAVWATEEREPRREEASEATELSMELMTDEMAPVGATEEMTELTSPRMEDRKDWTWAWATEAPMAATKMVEKRMMIVFVWRAEALNVSKGLCESSGVRS